MNQIAKLLATLKKEKRNLSENEQLSQLIHKITFFKDMRITKAADLLEIASLLRYKTA